MAKIPSIHDHIKDNEKKEEDEMKSKEKAVAAIKKKQEGSSDEDLKKKKIPKEISTPKNPKATGDGEPKDPKPQ